MDDTSRNLDIEAMIQRFQERAKAVRKRNMPPVTGAERAAFIKQAELDFQDFAMIADAKISMDGGILMIDLRPAICDAAIRGVGHLERETLAAMENIANARPLDSLDALPADGAKVRPPMPDDGNDYEWDVDFGWIEAMPNERP